MMKTFSYSSSDNLCANCGFAAASRFCAECGQSQKEPVLSVGAWMHDVFQELISVDGRFFVSIRSLLFSPGKLDSEWHLGRRKKYLSPNRLYLISAAFLFFASSLVPTHNSPITEIASGVIHAHYNDTETKKSKVTEKKVFEKASRWVSTSLKWILIFGMVPTLAILTMVLLGHKNEFYASHLVVSLHAHSVLFLCLGCMLLSLKLAGFGTVPDSAENLGFITVLPVIVIYSAVLFHRVFERNWVSTIIRFSLVFLGYVLVLILVAVFISIAAVNENDISKTLSIFGSSGLFGQ